MQGPNRHGPKGPRAASGTAGQRAKNKKTGQNPAFCLVISLFRKCYGGYHYYIVAKYLRLRRDAETMKRKALIISNPGEKETDEHYCRGVFVDVANYKRFLTSPLGGAWEISEIAELHRPTSKQVETEVSKLSAYDYTMILFTGHGYFSQRSESTILELKKNEEFDSDDLKKNTTKRTIILDCCRVVVEDLIVGKMVEDVLAKAIKQPLNAAECRRYFDETLAKCSNGPIVGYSCSKNEKSRDSSSDGGYYASGLLRAASNWRDQKDGHIDLSKQYLPFSVVEAHDAAVPLTVRRSGGAQTPNIDKARSGPYFPFAIMA
jgi:hypothetical protein